MASYSIAINSLIKKYIERKIKDYSKAASLDVALELIRLRVRRRDEMGVLNFAEIMDKSIEILKKKLKSLIFYNLGYGVILFLSSIPLIIAGSVIIAIFAPIFDAWGGMLIICLLIASLVGFIMSFKIGVMKIVSEEYTGEEVFAFDAIKESFKKSPKVMGMYSLAFLIYGPVIASVIYVLNRFYYEIGMSLLLNQNAVTGMVISTLIGIVFIILLVVGITTLYTSLLIFSIPIITFEDGGVIYSLKKSFIMVKKNFWRIVGCNILIYLSVIAIRVSIESFVGLLVAVFFIVLRIFDNNQSFMTMLYAVSGVLRNPLNIITYFIFAPLNAIMISLLYFNERFKQEGFDLVLKLRKIRRMKERN